jgi:hypothetical protein
LRYTVIVIGSRSLQFFSFLKKKFLPMSTEATNKPVFRDLQADDADPEITEISSLCFNCGEDVNFGIIDVCASKKFICFLCRA